jgi:biopolymer transport protein ExbB
LEGIESLWVEAQRKDELLLSAFTASAPLLGLLGTVMGMMNTFDAVASVSGDTGSQVANGISSALITTQFGLVIALPGVFGIAHVQKKIRRLESRFAQCRFLLLEALQALQKESRVIPL